ncbi:MAG: hypothetical protein ACHREM_10675 [Polyangiales bacterium]
MLGRDDVHVRGPRVRWNDQLFHHAFPQLRFNRHWSLAVPMRAFAGEEAAAVPLLERYFQEVRCIGAHMLASRIKDGDFHRELALLLAHLVIAQPERALELTCKAIAVGADLQMYDVLPNPVRRTCVTAVRQRLLRDARWIGAIDDMMLVGFGEEQATRELGSAVGDGRLHEMRMIARSVRQADPDCEFHASLAQSAALGGDASEVGELLQALPIGAAWYWALYMVRDVRPQILGQLVQVPAWRASGFFGARHIVRSVRSATESIDIAEHQDELQRLLRWEMIASHDADPADAFDVVESDLTEDTRYRNGKWEPAKEIHREAWRDRLQEPWSTAPVVDWLVLALARRATPALLCAAQQLLPLLTATQSDQAQRIAVACVDAYAASLTLGARRPNPIRTRGFPERLWQVVATLRTRGLDAEERRLLRPFDFAAYAATSRQELTSRADDNDVCPPWDAGEVIRAHAGALLELIESAPETADVEAVVAALVDLCLADFAAGDGRRAFDSMERVEDRPVLHRLGIALRRSPRALAHTVTIVSKAPPALALAQLLAGLRSGTAADVVRKTLEGVLPGERVRAQSRFGLGEAIAMARALLDAGEAGEALLFADAAVSTATKSKARPLEHDAFTLRWRSLYQAKRFEDLLAESDEGWKSDTLLPIQALALADRGAHARARELLDRVLRTNACHQMALVNRVATFIAEKNWIEAVGAVEKARVNLIGAVPPELHLSWAVANVELGRWTAAQEGLDALPPEYSRAPLGIRVRILLWSRSVGMGRGLRDDVDALGRAAPADAKELGRLLSSRALDWELHAIVLDGEGATDFDEHCRRGGTNPAEVLEQRLVRACMTLARFPNLMQALTEDHRTQILAWLVADHGSGLVVGVGERGGVAPKEEAVVDITLSTSDRGSHDGRRALVRGEAKTWERPDWIVKGLGQAFGAGNVGEEHFLLELIYCDTADFEHCIKVAREGITTYSVMLEGKPCFVAEGGVERHDEGDKVCVLRSVHRVKPDGDHRRHVRTILVDVRSAPEREARAPKPKRRARGTKPAAPRKRSSR